MADQGSVEIETLVTAIREAARQSKCASAPRSKLRDIWIKYTLDKTSAALAVDLSR